MKGVRGQSRDSLLRQAVPTIDELSRLEGRLAETRARTLVVYAPTVELGECSGISLTEPERARARAFRFWQDRDDFVAAHRLVRFLAALVSGKDPRELTLVQRCEGCGGSHGKPRIRELDSVDVSMSHVRGFVAAAVSLEGTVGVDIETFGSFIDAEVADHCLSPREMARLEEFDDYPAFAAAAGASNAGRALLRQWIRKEALVKIGALTLDGMAGMDLQNLEYGEKCLRRWGNGKHQFIDWTDSFHRVIGSVAAAKDMVRPLLVGLRR